MWSAVGEDEVRKMLARNDGIRCLIAALGDIAIQDVAVQSQPLSTDRTASRQACLACKYGGGNFRAKLSLGQPPKDSPARIADYWDEASIRIILKRLARAATASCVSSISCRISNST